MLRLQVNFNASDFSPRPGRINTRAGFSSCGLRTRRDSLLESGDGAAFDLRSGAAGGPARVRNPVLRADRDPDARAPGERATALRYGRRASSGRRAARAGGRFFAHRNSQALLWIPTVASRLGALEVAGGS